MVHGVDVLCRGFPGRACVGYLGWATVALVRTEDCLILYDTGAQAARPVLLAALRDRSLKPEDIDIVVFSHSHFDHLGNVRLFKKARFMMSQAEWDYAYGNENDICVELGAMEFLASKQIELIPNEGMEIVPGVEAILTPGHTPGSLSLLVKKKGETWALAGDAIKNRAELATELVDMTLEQKVSTESIVKVKSLAQRVLPGHDGWLGLTGEGVVAEEEVGVRITLPAGMTEIFDLGLDPGLFIPK